MSNIRHTNTYQYSAIHECKKSKELDTFVGLWREEWGISADNTWVTPIFFCPFCGIELEVIEKDSEGNLKVEIIEEEK